ncbi:MAG: DNA-directed RNA polymerase subunit alpha [Firmicutes bacterium]|nr:DNA-directed RNA polymerase subunit alpha [Bacillota bacterium]
MMQINKPEIKVVESENGKVAKFTVQPLTQGYGTTLGNALRRVLLSELPSAAISGVKINNIMHEYSTIKGVKEDIVEIVLNLKDVAVKANSTDTNFEEKLKLVKRGAGPVYAKDIAFNDRVEIINKELLLFTAEDDANVDMEIFVTVGRGYVPASTQKVSEREVGYIPVDALYSPVKAVNYVVEGARVGQDMNFDRLVLEVTTNGSKPAAEITALAAKSLVEHVNMFVEISSTIAGLTILKVEEQDQSVKLLEMTIDDMDLTTRSHSALVRAGIKTIEDLTKRTRSEIMKVKNLGQKSFEEIEEKILSYGLNFKEELE